MIILKTRSEVKVTVTQKWNATLRHPKMHPHTKFGIPTSKNIGDMDRTRKRDGHTDRRTDSVITICLPKFLWGHKNKKPRVVSLVCSSTTRLDLHSYLVLSTYLKWLWSSDAKMSKVKIKLQREIIKKVSKLELSIL